MKLYEVPNRNYVRVLEDMEGPPDAVGFKKGDVVFFDHIDGMYSFCKDSEDNICHLKAWTEVEIADVPTW